VLKNFEINIVLKFSKRGTNFSIETSSDSKWILNENSEKLLGLKFNRICYNFFLESLNLNETWKRGLFLHLDTKLTHEEEFEAQLGIPYLGLEGLN
jgi:hypothetical protein